MRNRPETLAGRWAAKEAVSKVLGLGVRGVGWREIEIVRLPTGQPTVRLHDRAKRRAEQLGMGRIAVSISHEREYAVAIAFGVRTRGRRVRLPARHRGAARRPRAADPGAHAAAAGPGARGPRMSAPANRRRPAATPADWRRSRHRTASRRLDRGVGRAPRAGTADPRGHKGTFGTLLGVCGSLDYLGAALLVGHAALRAGRRPRVAGRARLAPAARRRAASSRP